MVVFASATPSIFFDPARQPAPDQENEDGSADFECELDYLVFI